MPHEGLVWRSIFLDSVSRCLGKSNFGKSQQPRFVPSQTVVVASVVIFSFSLKKYYWDKEFSRFAKLVVLPIF